MALIWRGIFAIDDDAAVYDAATHIENWLRWKLHDDTIELPDGGALIEHASGCEISARAVRDGDLWGLRAALFEPRGEEQLRTTVTAAHDGGAAWVWVDLERWSADAFVEPWVPIAPGVVSTLLRETHAVAGRHSSRTRPRSSPATTEPCLLSVCSTQAASFRTSSSLRHARSATAT